MKVLILGASGATGKLVAIHLIKKQINIRVVVRENALLSQEILKNPLVEIVKGNITEFDNSKITNLIEDCEAVVSCLGHNITFKGMFGKPHNLVNNTLINICEKVKEKTDNNVKFILMSTTGYTNAEIGEKNSLSERVVLSLLKALLPPHRDNMKAANYLIEEIGKNTSNIEWIAVRPDTLTNEDTKSAYDVYESPIRSPIFNAGITSRINVSHFMTELLTIEELWQKWKFKMPVIYNKEQKKSA